MKRASITKRPYTYKGKTEDRWVVKWTDPKGERRENGKFQNKRHAEAFAAKIDRDIDRGIHEAGSGKMLFGEVWKKWIAHCEDRRKIGDMAGNTLVSYHWGADHILPEFGQRQIGKITSGDMEAWVVQKRETLSRHSVENFYGYIFQAFKYAVRQKWIARNPLRDDPVNVPGEKQEINVPSFEDVEKLIQILHGPQPPWWHRITWENHKIVFALRAFAGMRGGEIAALRWDTINLSATTLRIPKEAGSHSMVDGLKKPKSRAGVRLIPISQYLYDALLDHGHATDMKGFVIKAQRVSRLSVPRRRSLRVRQAAPDDVCLTSHTISDMQRELMKRADLTKLNSKGKIIGKFTGHDLRHWYISALQAIGLNLVAISKRVGHADPSITARMYSHLIEGAEDGLKVSVAPIWHQRLARAVPGRATMIEGVASESGLLIDGTATRLIETAIPENVGPPWVPGALRLLEGGWRPADVSRHLGQARVTIFATFHRLGLPNPDKIRRKVQDRKFGELLDAGYTDQQIAQKLNCSVDTVYRWRRTKAEGVPNTKAEFLRLRKGKPGDGKKLTDDQVHEVWDRLEAGNSCGAIAKRFSVSHGLISDIKSGQTYQWVKQEREKNEATQEPDKSLKYKEKLPTTDAAIAEKLRESQLKLL